MIELKSNYGYRYRIKRNKLTAEQLKQIRSQIGSRRYLWNQYVQWLETHSTKDTIPSYKQFTKEMPWAKEIDSCVYDNVKRDFKQALDNYNKNPNHYGKPKKKTKKKSKKSFKTTCNKHSIWLRGNYVKIPKIKEPLPIYKHRSLPPGHRITSAVITEEPDGTLYVSIQFNIIEKHHERAYISPEEIVGLDYSSPSFYVDDNGGEPGSPRAYREAEAGLARAVSVRDRKKKGSRNRARASLIVSKRHARVRHKREDFTQKESAAIAKRCGIVCVEDINLRGMAGSLCLGKSTNDNGFGAFRGLLPYKLAREGGGVLVKVPRSFASSKTCGCCGYKNKGLGLGDREWVCPSCGAELDRDLNAARNIRELGVFGLLVDGFVESMVDPDGVVFPVDGFSADDCYALARGVFPGSAGGAPVVTYVLSVSKVLDKSKSCSFEAVTLNKSLIGAFITAKKNSAATAAEAPSSEPR